MIYIAKNRIKKEALELLDRIADNIESIENQEIQEELGKLINHISYIAKRGDELLFKSAKIACSVLLNNSGELQIAKDINEEISRKKKQQYNNMTTPSKVVLCFGICFYAVIAFILAMKADIPDQIFGVSTALIILACVSGAIGSVISIMSRVGEFLNMDSGDYMVYLFTGFFKPPIGAAFALFIFSLVKSGIVPLDIGVGSQEALMVFILSFLSGFSERFATDITQKVEKTMASQAA